MDAKETKSTSKLLSLVLRHRPQAVGIELNESGWVEIDTLLAAITKHRRPLSREQLETVVRENDKQRFAISEDGNRIRANQGHSVEIELGYEPATPPEILYHGAPEQYLASIRSQGLKKMKRHHVHLHGDTRVAETVGSRRGQPVILKIRSADMHEAGFEFFVTPNQVWLTDHVPAEFIS